MIPEKAVEAALEAHRGPGNAKTAMRAALSAALPYLSEATKQPQRTSPTDWPDVPRRQ